MNEFEMTTSTESRTDTASRCCCSVWVTVEAERYADASVITVPQWEDYIALGTKIDEGEGTRPILLLLAVVTDRFVFNTASRSEDENTETKELGC